SRPLGSPGDAIEIIALDVIFDDAEMPVAIVRIVEAGTPCGLVPEVNLETFEEIRIAPQFERVAAFLHPGIAFHAALLRLRQHPLEYIPVRMLGGAADRP